MTLTDEQLDELEAKIKPNYVNTSEVFVPVGVLRELLALGRRELARCVRQDEPLQRVSVAVRRIDWDELDRMRCVDCGRTDGEHDPECAGHPDQEWLT